MIFREGTGKKKQEIKGELKAGLGRDFNPLVNSDMNERDPQPEKDPEDF